MPDGFQQLYDSYAMWAVRAREALKEGEEAAHAAPAAYAAVDEVVVCGVGGSGVVGEYLMTLSNHYGGVPITVARSVQPPRRVGRRTLVLGVSFSGATVETVRCVESATSNGALVAVVSGRGPLAERAQTHGWVLIRVPQGPAARAMFSYLLYASLGFLRGLGLLSIPGSEVEASITALADTKIDDLAEDHAKKVGKATLFISVVGDELAPLAIRLCQELEENAKTPAIPVYAPESLHNFIESIENLKKLQHVAMIAFKWSGYSAKPLFDYLVASLDITPKIVVEVAKPGLLEALAWSTLYAGFLSIYVAREKGVDPLSTPRIKEARKIAEERL